MKLVITLEKKIMAAIFILALLVRLTYVLTGSLNQPLSGDAVEYNLVAVNFLHGQGFQSNNNWSFQPPLYSLCLAGVYAVAGEAHNVIRILQTILSSLSCVLIFILAWRLAGVRAATWAGGLACIYPGLVTYSGALLSETLFVFLLLLAVIYIQASRGSGRAGDNIWAGLFLGLATLTRGVSSLVLPLVFAWWLIEDRDLKKSLRSIALIALVFVITLVPWTARNYARYHHIIPVDSHGGKVLVDSNNPLAQGQWTPEWIKEQHPEIAQQDEVSANKAYTKLALDYLSQAGPVRLAKLAVLKIMYFLYPFLPQYDILFMFLLPFWLSGMYLAFKQHHYLLLVLIFNFLLITLVFFGSPRIRDTAAPFIIILASLPLAPAARNVRGGKIKAVLVSLWLGVNLLVGFYAEPVRLFIKSWKGS
jgi:4-amino-4-deoxy-L-arabinose transferase-like glycosyltransferase